MKITAKDIVTLLRERHNEDIFIPECKVGQSYGPNNYRLDAWAMTKSWSHPRMIGYEVKVSRGDFLSDNKWPNYLDYCNQFYFVCPKGVIELSEVPEGVGLLIVASTGTKLFTKRKAPLREVQIPDTIYRYILMNRVEIISDRSKGKDPASYWHKWIEEKNYNQCWGHELSRKFSKRLNLEIRNVQEENKKLKENADKVEIAISALQANGIDLEELFRGNIRNKIDELLNGVPPTFKNKLLSVSKEINLVLGIIEELENKR